METTSKIHKKKNKINRYKITYIIISVLYSAWRFHGSISNYITGAIIGITFVGLGEYLFHKDIF